jgi:hypothetical protein
MDRVAAHVEAFNHAVATGDWETFATRFATDARMSFPGLPIGPYDGREAIAAAYRDNPPTETMTITGATTTGTTTTGTAVTGTTAAATAGTAVTGSTAAATTGTAVTGDGHTVRFRWASGATGIMQLTWTADAQVASLAITFD